MFLLRKNRYQSTDFW